MKGVTPLMIAQSLKVRDYTGRSVLTLLVNTKLYEFL